MDEHAQYEIRVYAEAMAKCAQAVAPIAYEAFEEHILHSVRFSRAECVSLQQMLRGRSPAWKEGPSLGFVKLERISKMASIDAPDEFEGPKPVDMG